MSMLLDNTQLVINPNELENDQLLKQWNVEENPSAVFLTKVSTVSNEKESSYY